MFDLPVLEDADSIQMALGQIMRMIVCRQVDTKSAGLLLYGLQIASANLRRTRFETCHKESITVDLFHVPERVLGDDAWSPADFKNADVGRAPSPAASSPAKETHVARTPSSAKESCASQTPPEPQPEAPSPAKESSSSDGGRTCPELKAKESPPATPRSAKESCAAPTPPEPQPKTPSSGNQSSPACDISSSSVASPQQRELQKAARAIPRALKGDWRCGALMRGRPKHAIC